jgi:hypothetical protein
MKKWTIILLCLLSLLFLCVTATGTASNKALEEKIVAQKKQGWETIKKKGTGLRILPGNCCQARLTRHS